MYATDASGTALHIAPVAAPPILPALGVAPVVAPLGVQVVVPPIVAALAPVAAPPMVQLAPAPGLAAPVVLPLGVQAAVPPIVAAPPIAAALGVAPGLAVGPQAAPLPPFTVPLQLLFMMALTVYSTLQKERFALPEQIKA